MDSKVLQMDMSAEQLMEHVRSEARNAGAEAAGEKAAAMIEQSIRQQDKIGFTAADQVAKATAAEFRKELSRSLKTNGGTFVGRPGFADQNAHEIGVTAKSIWAMARGNFSRDNVLQTADALAKGDEGRWGDVNKTLQATDFSSGGGLIEGQTSDTFIEALYAKNVVLNMGAQTVDLSNGPVDMNKQNQTPVFYWVGENEPITVSQPSFGKLVLQEKQGAILVPISEMLLERLPAGMEAIIERSMVQTANNGLDTAYISGEGSAASPKGIYHWTAANQILGAADYVEGAAVTLAEVTDALLKAWYQPQKANIPGLNFGWMFHPRIASFLMSLRSTDGYHVYLDQIAAGNLYGDPIGVSTNIPNNRGAGSNETRIYFGDFSQLVVGQGTTLRVSRGSGVSFVDGNGNTVHGFQEGVELIKLTLTTDMVMMHNEAFAILDVCQWGSAFDS